MTINSQPMNETDALKAALEQLRRGTLAPHAFSAQARQASALLQALPARYAEVLLQLLDRLESSALFSEESCSFSQSGLLDNLQAWLDKAQARIGQASPHQA
jgi:hypothetical protein